MGGSWNKYSSWRSQTNKFIHRIALFIYNSRELETNIPWWKTHEWEGWQRCEWAEVRGRNYKEPSANFWSDGNVHYLDLLMVSWAKLIVFLKCVHLITYQLYLKNMLQIKKEDAHENKIEQNLFSRKKVIVVTMKTI